MITRKLANDLISHLPKKEISLIIGPRQAGKTTLMMQLREILQNQGKKTIIFNLDIETDKIFFSSQETLLRKIRMEFGDGPGTVFIDEMQRKENAGLFLKGIYDIGLPYKFVVSGSGSVELKEKIHESLAGRKRVFELGTLSFNEFVNHRTGYRYGDNLLEFYELEKDRTRDLLTEFMGYGGYPRVVLDDSADEKRKIIAEIYQSYMEKDISYLLNIKKTELFTSLVKLVSARIGSLSNISELSSTLGSSAPTIKDYLWYLEKTFIIKKASPFHRNTTKEIVRSQVYYFTDLGFRNYALGQLGRIEGHTGDAGLLFQNFIHNLLADELRDTSANLRFWRTKSGAEVDFIIDMGAELLPVEVKFAVLKKPEVSKSLRAFIAKYSPSRAIIVNLDFESEIKINGTNLFFVPFYKLGDLVRKTP